MKRTSRLATVEEKRSLAASTRDSPTQRRGEKRKSRVAVASPDIEMLSRLGGRQRYAGPLRPPVSGKSEPRET